jgi:proteasome lid subunit RPN8/RPN11
MSEVNRDDEFSFDDIKIHSAEVVDKPVHASPYASPVEIIVGAAAWNHMNRHACEDLRHEAGGVMLGGIYDHGGTLFVRITTAVAARGAVNSVASIQFTYDAWSHMEKERQRSAPDEKLLGWYHTHPGFSAFFSEADRFLHENFFTQPWHVALVIDPIQGDYRFYRWDQGRVHEVKEFLLKVDDWPGPQPPLNAVLSTALRNGMRQAETEDAAAATPLRPVMEKLLVSLRRGVTEKPASDLLSLIVACADLTPEAVAEARKRIAVEGPVDGPIHYTDLEVCGNNTYPEGAISIAQRWLVQQSDGQGLHFHALDESQPLCAKVRVPLAVRDLSITESGYVLLLTRSQDHLLHFIEPPLNRLAGGRRAGEQNPIAVAPAEIDWGSRSRPAKVGKLLAAPQGVFLLTKKELWVLGSRGSSRTPRFECLSVHSSTACGWDSFAELVDWTCDAIGNLYLLSAEHKEVWRFDRLTENWSRFIVDAELHQPRSVTAGSSMLSVYDGGGTPAIVQYSLSDGRLLARRRLDPEVQQLRIWHLFSDWQQLLYLVTEGYVFRLR